MVPLGDLFPPIAHLVDPSCPCVHSYPARRFLRVVPFSYPFSEFELDTSSTSSHGLLACCNKLELSMSMILWFTYHLANDHRSVICWRFTPLWYAFVGLYMESISVNLPQLEETYQVSQYHPLTNHVYTAVGNIRANQKSSSWPFLFVLDCFFHHSVSSRRSNPIWKIPLPTPPGSMVRSLMRRKRLCWSLCKAILPPPASRTRNLSQLPMWPMLLASCRWKLVQDFQEEIPASTTGLCLPASYVTHLFNR